MRELAAAARPTASPLRLSLQAGGTDRVRLSILKRRGPPLEAPLHLALPPVLSEAARRRAQQGLQQPVRRLHEAVFVNLA
jgi:protein ImuA